jgi:hypothetical protein
VIRASFTIAPGCPRSTARAYHRAAAITLGNAGCDDGTVVAAATCVVGRLAAAAVAGAVAGLVAG